MAYNVRCTEGGAATVFESTKHNNPIFAYLVRSAACLIIMTQLNQAAAALMASCYMLYQIVSNFLNFYYLVLLTRIPLRRPQRAMKVLFQPTTK